MKVLAIIPARMGSSRFPGKPMEKILGMPMIGHVYNRTKKSPLVNDTYVATCDKEIFDYITSIGGKAVMTEDTHERCTDRTSEALLKIEKDMNQKFDIVLMIQGDEPMVTPSMVDASLSAILADKSVNVVNLASKITDPAEFNDPNTVKVVFDKNWNALYFSREPIPSVKKNTREFIWYKQICVIPFRRDFLIEFNNLSETPLERIESVDMMRILEHGQKVKMVEHNVVSQAVDTKADLIKVEKLMKDDDLIKTYI